MSGTICRPKLFRQGTWVGKIVVGDRGRSYGIVVRE